MCQLAMCESGGLKLIVDAWKYKHGVNGDASSPLAWVRMHFIGMSVIQNSDNKPVNVISVVYGQITD